jgi:hypothetical protein
MGFRGGKEEGAIKGPRGSRWAWCCLTGLRREEEEEEKERRGDEELDTVQDEAEYGEMERRRGEKEPW